MFSIYIIYIALYASLDACALNKEDIFKQRQ